MIELIQRDENQITQNIPETLRTSMPFIEQIEAEPGKWECT